MRVAGREGLFAASGVVCLVRVAGREGLLQLVG